MKVYTKTGDQGTTSLIGGERVFKSDERVEAYGSVDELMAFTALLGDHMRDEEGLSAYVDDIAQITSRLMTVSALLAVGQGGEGKVAPLAASSVEWLEHRIDAMQALVPPITKFTIPGGNAVVSCATSAGRSAAGRSVRRCVPLRSTAPTPRRWSTSTACRTTSTCWDAC